MIRDMRIDDCKNLAALSIQVWLDTYAREGIRTEFSEFVLSCFTPAYFEEILESCNRHLLVCEIKDHLVGYVSMDTDPERPDTSCIGAEIVTLYIIHAFHRRGLGSQLVRSARERCGPRLWLTAWIHNDPAIRFYESIGFKRVGRTWFDLMGEQHENLILAG
ncbi:MAG: GNAT family N-acetyltransferase [Desulfobacteraceae bacterium]|nr:MAG: GNAT family N-acetyltransferase [Desulfobacteraceae bacterium]